ncbi:hypothetical protein M8J77_011828 [Diaphorina citri]|nr:hypothetical protein M8J77_011828 [Diaphorina citri]
MYSFNVFVSQGNSAPRPSTPSSYHHHHQAAAHHQHHHQTQHQHNSLNAVGSQSSLHTIKAITRPPTMTANLAPTPSAIYRGPTAPWNANHPPGPQHYRYNPYNPLPPSYTSPTIYSQPNNSYHRVSNATSPANTHSSSSSNTGSQNGGTHPITTNNVQHNGSPGTPTGPEQLSKTNLYIRGLTQDTTDKDLINMCSQYGPIISTKAILDKTTNKCRGYGFVDFESGGYALAAVKALQDKGIHAQMARVGITTQNQHERCLSQQEQDPTNLYIANLPLNFKECDLESLLAKYVTVVSTRILRDNNNTSKGVGFARLESKDKCDQMIQLFNGSTLPGSKEPLLVKFADSGLKKRGAGAGGPNIYRGPGAEVRLWGRDSADSQLAYEHPMTPIPATIQYQRFTAGPGGTGHIPAGYTPWVPTQYVMPAPHMSQVEMIQQAGDPSMSQYSSMLPQLAAQMSALHIGTTGSYITASHHPGAYPSYFTTTGAPSMLATHHTLALTAAPDSLEHPSNAASPDGPEIYQTYPGPHK